MEKIERIPTKIEGLDELIGGGIPRGISVLIAGEPGAGKTVLALQTANNFIEQGERVVYLSLESISAIQGQVSNKLLVMADQFGFKLRKYAEERKFLILAPTKVEVRINALVDNIKALVTGKDPITVVIIDPFTKLMEIGEIEESKEEKKEGEKPLVIESERAATRRDMWWLLMKLSEFCDLNNVTRMFVGESDDVTERITVNGVAEYDCDGVIVLKTNESLGKRMLSIKKMRSTPITFLPKEFDFTESGIVLGKK